MTVPFDSWISDSATHIGKVTSVKCRGETQDSMRLTMLCCSRNDLREKQIRGYHGRHLELRSYFICHALRLSPLWRPWNFQIIPENLGWRVQDPKNTIVGCKGHAISYPYCRPCQTVPNIRHPQAQMVEPHSSPDQLPRTDRWIPSYPDWWSNPEGYCGARIWTQLH